MTSLLSWKRTAAHSFRKMDWELMSEIHIEQADLNDEGTQRDVLEMVNGYASDPMGNGKPLPEEISGRLIEGLRQHPTTVILLAYRKEQILR